MARGRSRLCSVQQWQTLLARTRHWEKRRQQVGGNVLWKFEEIKTYLQIWTKRKVQKRPYEEKYNNQAWFAR